MPKVSVCIPAYNQPAFLKKAIESVLRQTYGNYEIIVTDDSPNDSVEKMVENLNVNGKINYFKNPTALGSPQNWNAAIEKAKGEYIKILHHDDFFTENNSLALMMEQIEKEKTDFLFCATKVWYPAKNFSRIHSLRPNHIIRMKNEIEFLFFYNMVGSPSATLYKKDNALQFDKNLIWLVDFDFYIRYIHQHKKFSYLDKPLICTTHETEHQLTGKLVNDREIQIKERVLVFNKIINYIKNKESYISYFEYMFRDLNVNSLEELLKIVPEAKEKKEFYSSLINSSNKNVFWKRLKRKVYRDILKTEQF